MNEYTLYCTSEQTRKALDLGAQIETQEYCPPGGLENDWFAKGRLCFHKPTVEQMIGWLRSKNIKFHFDDFTTLWQIIINTRIIAEGHSEQKELAAITAALDWLVSKNL